MKTLLLSFLLAATAASSQAAPAVIGEKRLVNGRTAIVDTNWFNVTGKIVRNVAGGWIVQAKVKRPGDLAPWSGTIFLRNPDQSLYQRYHQDFARYQELKRQREALQAQLENHHEDYVEAKARSTVTGQARLDNRNTIADQKKVVAYTNAERDRYNAAERIEIVRDKIALIDRDLSKLADFAGETAFEVYERALLTGEVFQKMPVYNCGTPVK